MSPSVPAALFSGWHFRDRNLGGLVYRLAYRRRTIVASHPWVSSVPCDDIEGHRPFDLPPSLPGVLLQQGF